ncbi:hypothetical protein I302_108523 [Kwoniella bestiolae CBS 10118]|uniref:BRCT domain-containing protein n=1 Tax=Kwoniella bestiolae CBS 10118 TaxID=1296100 RepID=A0A1B9FVG8_9TREE|nr:hypothetical protein I302_07103 [Kwoniella bestiolae CBS 10118]OCF22762.1 hypothetical protein I302_07103 [Kwoniella bestiolae CBS 10118]
MSYPTTNIFHGFTFYVQPRCKMSQDSLDQVKQRDDLIDLVRNHGGSISSSPTHPSVTHILITSLTTFPKNEIITLRRLSYSSPPVRYLDENGWATFRLVEEFSGILTDPTYRLQPFSSTCRMSNGDEEAEMWDGRKVVLKQDWLYDCAARGKVLGEYQNWGGWRVRGRFTVGPPLNIPLPQLPFDCKPSTKPTSVTVEWYEPPEYNSEPVHLVTRKYTCTTIPINPSNRLPQIVWATKDYHGYLDFTEDQLRPPRVFLMGVLPPDPRSFPRHTGSPTKTQLTDYEPVGTKYGLSIERREEKDEYDDLDCLDSDREQDELDNDMVDSRGCSSGMVNAISSKYCSAATSEIVNILKTDKNTYGNNTNSSTEFPSTIKLRLKMTARSTSNSSSRKVSFQLPPTPISAFLQTEPIGLADSQAFPLPKRKRPHTGDLDCTRGKKPKPSPDEVCHILAQELFRHPDESQASISARLEGLYEGRKWTTWKRSFSRYEERIDKVLRGLQGR